MSLGMEIINKPVIPTGQTDGKTEGVSTKWTVWLVGRKSQKIREQNIAHFNIYIYTHSRSHTYKLTH